MFLVALDPGVTVGWATFQTGERYKSGQWLHYKTWSMLDTGAFQRGIDVVIYESFQYRPHMPKVNLTPVEVIGVVKEWCRQNKVQCVGQTPAQGKAFWTDERLQKMHLYKPGKPHANDATRHLLYYMYFGKGKGVIDISGIPK
jgi:hypothetical protein